MKLFDWDWQNDIESFTDLPQAKREAIEAECKREIYDDDIVDEQFDRYLSEKGASDTRYNIRTSLIAAFNPEGPIGSHWTLGGCIPLREFRSHDQHQVDILVGKSGDEDAIAIVSVVPSEDVSAAFDEAREIADWLLKNPDTIYSEMEVRIGDDEPDVALAVTKNAADAAEEIGNHNSGREAGRVTVWQFIGGEGELVQQYDNQSADWDPYVPDGELGEMMQEGVEAVDIPHTWPDIFLDTHHERVLRNIIVEFVENSEDGEVPDKHFSREQFEEYLKNNIEGAAQNNRQVRDRAQELIDWWQNIGIIEGVPKSQNRFDGQPPAYRFKTDKNSGSEIEKDLMGIYDYKSALYASEIQIKSKNLD